jgi:hypothetical protein
MSPISGRYLGTSQQGHGIHDEASYRRSVRMSANRGRPKVMAGGQSDANDPRATYGSISSDKKAPDGAGALNDGDVFHQSFATAGNLTPGSRFNSLRRRQHFFDQNHRTYWRKMGWPRVTWH